MAGVADSFVRLVRRIVGLPETPGQPPDIMRLGLYPASVVAQNADGTVDVRPTDDRIGGEKNVKVRVGIPGSSASVAPGSIVLLGWERGDPSKIFCMPAWDAGAQLLSLTIGDAAGDSITLANGVVTIKVGGVQVLQASPTKLALGLNALFPVLVQGSTDSVFGAPVLQNPAATGTIVDAG
jgi:hypothetical protein